MRIVCVLMLLFLPIDLTAKCGIPTTPRHNQARIQFMKQTGYPHGRKGWVVDHIIPLCKGGKDEPANMQWQTKQEAKAKDRIECKCAKEAINEFS